MKDLVQEVTINSRKTPLAVWSLFLSKRQNFLNDHPARIPATPNQQGTHEMRDEVLSSVSSPDMDASVYQMSDLVDVEFYWENDQLVVDAVLRPGIDTLFSPATSDNLEIGGSAENPILLDKNKDKENSPSAASVSEKPTRPPAWLRSLPFGTTKENVPDYVYRSLFQKVIHVSISIKLFLT